MNPISLLTSLQLLLLCATTTPAIAVPARTRPPGIQQFLGRWSNSPLASYPTDFTRGIMPIRIHSHNDYWRDVPLYSAIAAGAISVEADVWLYNDTLFVGHDTSSLTENRTLDSLYIDPLVAILEAQNPLSAFVSEDGTPNGVFDTSVGQTLFLWIDVKTDGNATWPHVVSALEPLRRRGYLTKLRSDGGVDLGPVTVIGTGNTPAELVVPVEERDYFLDGPLLTLDADNITKEISPVASVKLSLAVGGEVGPAGLNETQLEAVRKIVAAADKRGIRARFWDLPGWPVRLRNTVWQQVMSLGTFLLNVDDLEEAAGMGGTGANW